MNMCSPNNCDACEAVTAIISLIVLFLIINQILSFISIRKRADEKIIEAIKMSELLKTHLKDYRTKVNKNYKVLSRSSLNSFIDRCIKFDQDLDFIHKSKYDYEKRNRLDDVIRSYCICVKDLIEDIEIQSTKDSLLLNTKHDT